MSVNTRNRTTISARPDYRYIVFNIPLIFVASLVGAVGVNLFLLPAQLAPGGITGIGIILNELIGIPIGLVIFIGNILLLAIGYRQLGGWNTVIITFIFASLFSINVEAVRPFIPADGISDDRLLNTLYSGVVGGVTGGFIYRLGGTMGGSSILSRILNNRFGLPLSSSYLYVDSIVILGAGVVFGWESALFSLIVLVVDGFVSDYVLEGPSLIRVVTIITDQSDAVSEAIMSQMSRGVTSWTGRGRYTNQSHDVLFVTITRSQVNMLQNLVHEADPYAFVVVGNGQVAYGGGFMGKGRGGRLPQPLPKLSSLFKRQKAASTDPDTTPETRELL